MQSGSGYVTEVTERNCVSLALSGTRPCGGVASFDGAKRSGQHDHPPKLEETKLNEAAIAATARVLQGRPRRCRRHAF